MRFTSSLVLIALIGTTACSTTSPGFVAREWSRNMRELGVYPVFPPREDIQVGDIFLMPVFDESCREKALSNGPLPLSVLLASIPTAGTQADSVYASRLAFPVTPSRGNSSPPSPAPSAFPIGERRLRVVGFPSFLSATVSGANVGAFLTASGLPFNAGVALERASVATVSVSVAESYAVPLATLVPSLFDSSTTERRLNGELFGGLPPEVFRVDQRRADCGLSASQVEIVLVSEVFYTRKIDVALSSSASAGLAVGYVKPGESAPGAREDDAGTAPDGSSSNSSSGAAAAAPSDKPTPGTTGVAPAETPSPTATEGKSPPVAASKQSSDALKGAESARRSAMEQSQMLAKRHKVPGATVDVSSSSRGDVALSVEFDRPVAIGYRGIAYCVTADRRVCGVTIPGEGQVPLTGEGVGPKK